MSNSTARLKPIKRQITKGLICHLVPASILGQIDIYLTSKESSLDILLNSFSPGVGVIISSSIGLTVTFLFLYGYVICWIAAHKYAKYKGYPGYFGLVGIFSIFGLSFLFLLKNRNLEDSAYSEDNPFEEISISAIFISYFAIAILSMPILIVIIIIGSDLGIEEAGDYLFKNENISAILNVPLAVIISCYIFNEIKRANLNLKQILGSLKNINYKLPIGLAILKYFFAWGFNPTTLYCLSFVLPTYVENQINKEHVTTYGGFVAYAVGAVIFAPIIEELFFRGIIFQKLAIKKNVVQALCISAFIFTILHFRYDLVSLFFTGSITVILYLKTKQLIVPIIYHFFYNLMVITGLFYHQFISDFDHSISVTIADYQQKFLDNLELKILFIALSAPYLIYFIYKNFPRNSDINKLPYFANKQQAPTQELIT